MAYLLAPIFARSVTANRPARIVSSCTYAQVFAIEVLAGNGPIKEQKIIDLVVSWSYNKFKHEHERVATTDLACVQVRGE